LDGTLIIGTGDGTRLPVDRHGADAIGPVWRRVTHTLPLLFAAEPELTGDAALRLLAAVAALLARVTAEEQVQFGVSSRVLSVLHNDALAAGIAPISPLTVQVPIAATMSELLREVGVAIDALPSHLAGDSAPPPRVLFDIAPDIVTGATPVPSAGELQLSIVTAGSALSARAEYDSSAFDERSVTRWLRTLERLWAAANESPDVPLAQLPLLTESERTHLLFGLNQTAVPRDTLLVHEQIAAQAARTPHAIALRTDAGDMTYAELDRLASRLAAELIARGVGPETLVGLCMSRSVGMVIALLAILKADGAFVPLDPELPPARLAYMLRDTATSLVLVDDGSAELVSSLVPHVAQVLVTPWLAAVNEHTTAPSPHATRATPEHLAYVIYTSGSTGDPKGVLLTHAGLSNHAAWYAKTLAIAASDRMLLHASIGFDAAMAELFPPLMAGATVVLAAPDAHIELRELPSTIATHGITLAQLVPSALRVALTSPAFGDCSALRFLVCGGEALDAELCASVRALLPSVQLGNFYGPSESTVDAASHVLLGALPSAGRVPIGTPIANVVCHVLDAQAMPLPMGCIGELYVGGVALARGYLGLPELTARKFIADPFRPGQRLYRTGDRARYRNDGLLEFLGRVDTQVKLRGYRIELSEVERAVASLPGVRDVVAEVRDDRDGDAQLVAYIVPEVRSTLDARQMRHDLEDTLPTWMIPGVIVMLDALPLTVNGKLDRRALPAPHHDHDIVEVGDTFADPLEASLANIWRQTLDLRSVRADDDFFHLGGHSLKVFRMLAEIERVHGVTLRASALFGAPTLRELADLVRPALARDVFVM
jgi:amino acid adenylation domain-containing protein